MLAVVGYHAGLGWARGGFLGVDAFFVISGYLITALLLAEWRQTGTVRLGAFWARRARRLLPALLVVLVVVCGWSAAGSRGTGSAPDRPVRSDALATLGYLANWRFAVSGEGYFDLDAPPSPLRHTWSLAIEEQFYLLWPLLVLAVLSRGRSFRRPGSPTAPGPPSPPSASGSPCPPYPQRPPDSPRPLLVVAVLGAVASALVMLGLYRSGSDPSRLYYGTDTRTQALLVGAAVAAVLAGRGQPGPAPSPRARRGLLTAGAVGALWTAWAWSRLDGGSPVLYQGGFALSALAVAAVMACVLRQPGSVLARGLSLSPLRALGRVSYGVYLWHWPVVVMLTRARTGYSGVGLFALRTAVTVVLAALSYRLLEQPVRRPQPWARPGWRLAVAGLATAALALAVAPASPPRPSSLASAVRSEVRPGPPAAGAVADPGEEQPARVLLVGDSVALTLGMGLSSGQAGQGVELVARGALGCGIAGGAPVRLHGRTVRPPDGCARWADDWAAHVEQTAPDVAAVLVGRWEVTDRWLGGRWAHVGQPAFDAHLSAQLERAVAVLSARGAIVVFLTSPYFSSPERADGARWSSDDPARVDRFNAILREAASRHPDRARVVELGQLLAPGGRYAQVVDGVQARWDDGVHVTEPGGQMLAPRLLPELARLARTPGPAARTRAGVPRAGRPGTAPGDRAILDSLRS